MLLPPGPLAVRTVPGVEVTPALAAVIVPGSGDYVRFVRQWVGALPATADYPGGELELAGAELFTNAARHSRSGEAGGEVTVIVAAGPGGAVLHVHDQGAAGGHVPHVKAQRAAGLAESGRGLRIVAAISVHWAARPAADCPQAPLGDPAVTAGGCCVWCHIRPGAARP
jgi:anti-sigma regulatory factor (Ser/Thr protein kinase)